MVQSPSSKKRTPAGKSAHEAPKAMSDFKPESEPMTTPVPERTAVKKAPAAKPPARKAPARPAAKAPAVKPPVKKPPVKKAAPKRAPAKKAAPRKPVDKTKLRTERKLSGIRAAAGEISRRLADIEKARVALGEGLKKSAGGDLSRVKNVVGMLTRTVESVPLIDPRRLEKDLAVLTERCGVLKEREAKGRKRDLFAVDDFIGKAAQRLERVVTSAAAANLKLLSERIGQLEAARNNIMSAVDTRFRTRLEKSKLILTTVQAAAMKLPAEGLGKVSTELDKVVSLLKAIPVEKLEGRKKDLFRLDYLIKQTAKRLGAVSELVEPAPAKKGSKGNAPKEAKASKEPAGAPKKGGAAPAASRRHADDDD